MSRSELWLSLCLSWVTDIYLTYELVRVVTFPMSILSDRHILPLSRSLLWFSLCLSWVTDTSYLALTSGQMSCVDACCHEYCSNQNYYLPPHLKSLRINTEGTTVVTSLLLTSQLCLIVHISWVTLPVTCGTMCVSEKISLRFLLCVIEPDHADFSFCNFFYGMPEFWNQSISSILTILNT